MVMDKERTLGQAQLFWQMTKMDLKKKYFGSVLGFMWAIVSPLMTTIILFIVYTVGFRGQSPVNSQLPFAYWLFAGLLPWFFISEVISNFTSCFQEYSYLVKKIVFPLHLVPLIKMGSALLVHLVLIAVCILTYSLFYSLPGWSISLMPLNILLSFYMLIGLGYFISSTSVFLPDMKELMGVVLQLFFWGTPIFWSLNMLPERFHFIMEWNPLYRLVEIYRFSFDASHDPSWILQSYIYVFAFSSLFLALGLKVFSRTRRHFVDVM